MFGAVLAFDAPTTSIEFDASVLGGRSSPGAASLREFLRDAPQSVFLKQVSEPVWSERVRRRLRRGADWPAASWQRVVDGLRHDLAVRLLSDRALSLEQVAESLGYGDARSLHRAFRKWTGAAPGAYRGS